MKNKIVCLIHVFLIVLEDEAAVFAAFCVLCVALSVRGRCDEGHSSGIGVMMSALRAACGCLFCLSCPKLVADWLNQCY